MQIKLVPSRYAQQITYYYFCPNMFAVLSANSDTKLVMKGITLGACDYLLKPVRIERLKNIWQHVIRKRMCDSKDQNKSPDLDKACHGTESANSVAISGNSGENDKLSMKQKHRNEEEKESGKDDENEKKPCVVWSVELHRKFVAAVNQLGLESECFATTTSTLLFLYGDDFISFLLFLTLKQLLSL